MQGIEENALISDDLVLHWELLVLGNKYIPLLYSQLIQYKKMQMINAPHIDHQGVHYI
jgi:hypothetical protein